MNQINLSFSSDSDFVCGPSEIANNKLSSETEFEFQNQIWFQDQNQLELYNLLDTDENQPTYQLVSFQIPSLSPNQIKEPMAAAAAKRKFQTLETKLEDEDSSSAKLFKSSNPMHLLFDKLASEISEVSAEAHPIPDFLARFDSCLSLVEDKSEFQKESGMQALQMVVSLHKELEDLKAHDNYQYLEAIKLLAKVLVKVNRVEVCIKYLTKIENETFSPTGPVRRVHLTCSLLLALLYTQQKRYEEALQKYEILAQKTQQHDLRNLGTHSNECFTKDQVLEMFHSKAAILLLLGKYEESLDTYDDTLALLDELKMSNKCQRFLIYAKMALVVLQSKNWLRARKISTAVLKKCKEDETVNERGCIEAIAKYVMEHCDKAEFFLGLGYHLPNYAENFVESLKEQQVNIFGGLEPRDWKFLFG